DESALLAGLAEQREAGRLALPGRERRIAQSPVAAAGGHEAGADADQVSQHGAVLRGDDRAVGDGQDEVLTAGTMTEVALAEPAAGGAPMGAVVVLQQRGGGRIDLEDHIAAAAPVGPVRAGQGLELLTDRKSTRLNSSHVSISYAVFCLNKQTASAFPSRL